ncbi:MAG: hypothetical protein ACK4S4_14280 [Pyrinomonadaceae bacterium]
MSISTDAVNVAPERLMQINRLIRVAGTEAVRLRIVERFLSEVERRIMKISTLVFDVERVRTAIQILKELSVEDDEEVCFEAEFRLEQEFKLWRTLIEQRDAQIETYHYRRFIDSTIEPLSDEIFISLTLFYRTIPFTPSSQSKFDLAVTRLFTGPRTSEIRTPRFSREEMAAKLTTLYANAGCPAGDAGDTEAAVATIDAFIGEARSFENVEDLIQSGIFGRYRQFKRELAERFFEPEIIAAGIECNLVFGNSFDLLLKRAKGGLSEKLTGGVDLVGVLHDAAPGAREHVSDLLSKMFRVEDNDSD